MPAPHRALLCSLALACDPAEESGVADPGPEPAAAVMLASAAWVYQSGESWRIYQRAAIPLVFSASAAARSTGARSEHCRVMSWAEQEPGLTPIQLQTSLVSATASWADGYYDIDGMQGEDPFGEPDTMTVSAEQVEIELQAPEYLSPGDVLGAEAGLSTMVHPQGFDLVWTQVFGSQTMPAVYCAQQVSGMEQGDEGPQAMALPEDGQELVDELGLDSMELLIGLAHSQVDQELFGHEVNVMAARVFYFDP